MLTDFQKKWVAALRSGTYSQGTGFLCRNDAYCCLGVACEVAAIPSRKYDPTCVGSYKTFEGMRVGIELESYQEMLGIKDALGSFIVNEVAAKITGAQIGKTTHLAFLNDHGCTFDQIADIIESEPFWTNGMEGMEVTNG